MHEQSLMNSLMRQVYSIAAEENAERVTSIKVWLGAMSHMSPDHFKEHFDEAAKGGIAESAKLEFEVSTDMRNPNATGIVIESIEVAQES